ncbi:MAG: hypothetical protein RLZZ462_346 [Bacteroidota bacterium]|jgi:hypothetical protein
MAMRRGAEIAVTFPSQALSCSGSTGFSQLLTAPRGQYKSKMLFLDEQL